MERLYENQKLELLDEENEGKRYITIIKKLGGGGQGEVYEVDFYGNRYALKWYFYEKINSPDEFYENLKRNIEMGSPSNSFLWPIELTKKQCGSFGYVMDLIPNKFKSFSDYLCKEAVFKNLDARFNAGLNIIDGFKNLHAKGYSYQDLNDGNFFIEPDFGDVLICDNDNVSEYGRNIAGIAGKKRYMAPEIVVGDKMPDIHTDRFSIALMLYLLLFMDHPFEGVNTLKCCMTEEVEQLVYGKELIFVWDPDNDKNRPVKDIHSNQIMLWPEFPEFIKKDFQKVFSWPYLHGDKREHRLTEREWMINFINLRSLAIKCPSCGEDIIIDPDSRKKVCSACGKDLSSIHILKVKSYNIALYPGKKLYECHTLGISENYSKITGDLLSKKDNPNIVGLKNLSDYTWKLKDLNGKTYEIKNNQILSTIKSGFEIDFGDGNKGIIY